MQPSLNSKAATPADSWARYAPSKHAPWNLRRVVHLHRRAGFAATWSEIERDLKDGPKLSIDRVLAGKSATVGVPEEFESTASILAQSAATSGDPARLKAWWLYRMLLGPDPLTERLTLMWHNHFATSNFKVNNLAAMLRQNEIFRKLGRGPFADLLQAVVHDPALLVWLDAPTNRKAHPNENLARELMELFTLGIGHYTEQDVKQSARALTGWSVVNDAFTTTKTQHDTGTKTILGQKGNWNGDDLVRILVDHPATSHRLAWRVASVFLGERAIRAADLGALAAGLRANDLSIGWAVETVLRSQAFFGDENLGNRVESPVEYVIGAARALEMMNPPCSTLILAEWCSRLGEDLFYPPNVGGWPGGRSWLTTRSLLGRAHFSEALVNGLPVGLDSPVDALALAQRHGEKNVLTFIPRLLLGVDPPPAWRGQLASARGPKPKTEGDVARRTVQFILSQPECQLA